MEKDVSIREHVDNVDELEKLVRYNKNLLELLRNFVNFEEFYSDAPAIFQYGRLFIDSRDCGLCIRVDDVSKHASLAAASYGYLIYCTCRRMGEANMNIVAVVTAGDSDNLIVGRNGVFYDRAGRDWDASVVKIIHNPVGLMQAFWSPYKRAIKWFSEQVAKYTSTADTKVVENLTESVLPPKASTKVEIKKIDVGTVAALGVAVGGITTAFGIILDSFLHLGYWIPLGVVGVVMAISLPSMIVAALKLRIRSLAPLLDANGWAVNGKAAISVLFGGKAYKGCERTAYRAQEPEKIARFKDIVCGHYFGDSFSGGGACVQKIRGRQKRVRRGGRGNSAPRRIRQTECGNLNGDRPLQKSLNTSVKSGKMLAFCIVKFGKYCACKNNPK